MINNSFSIPLSTLEAENYMPAMHAKSEPKISVCLLEKKVYGQIQSFHWKFNEKTGFINIKFQVTDNNAIFRIPYK